MDNAAIKKIWDGFGPEGQNMTLAEFRKEMHALTDPNKIQEDLADIELLKARERSNKIRIDRAQYRYPAKDE